MFLGFSYCMSQLIPLAQKYNTSLRKYAVPSIANVCALPMMTGIPRSFCHALASLHINANAPKTITMTLNLMYALYLNISSWYLSTFSFCVFKMFWSAGTAISIKIHSMSSFSKSVMSGLFCFSFSSMSHVLLLHFLCLVRVGVHITCI